MQDACSVLTEHEFHLTYIRSKGGFQVLSIPLGKTAGLICSISSSSSQLSRAIPGEPGAREDSTNRWAAITWTQAAKESHLLGSYTALGPACPLQGLLWALPAWGSRAAWGGDDTGPYPCW